MLEDAVLLRGGRRVLGEKKVSDGKRNVSFVPTAPALSSGETN